MDPELMLALLVLWISTTAALITFFFMWFFNEGEAFHPHSIDVDHRHSLFVVVQSDTRCKTDHAVKNISTYVAPRGSSSSKQFTALCVMIAVAGFLGTYRWYKVGDAKYLEAVLGLLGFASLLLVAFFELDVSSERFLEEKLLVTGWLLEKSGADKRLPFPLSPLNGEFRKFIRSSKGISHLYEEFDHCSSRHGKVKEWVKFHGLDQVSKVGINHMALADFLWNSLHMMGAINYVVLVTASIIINDLAEEKVAWLVGFFFVSFCLLGYITGSYFPVWGPLKTVLMTWNPFLKEPHFMLRLQEAVDDYVMERNGGGDGNSLLTNNKKKTMDHMNMNMNMNIASSMSSSLQGQGGSGDVMKMQRGRKSTSTTTGKSSSISSPSPSRSPSSSRARSLSSSTRKKKNNNNNNNKTIKDTTSPSVNDVKLIASSPTSFANAGMIGEEEFEKALEADKVLDNPFVRYARSNPRTYLKVVGHILVMSELLSIMTPAVAMGIQWVTALCDGPPLPAIWELVWTSILCFFRVVKGHDCEQTLSHCIVKEGISAIQGKAF